MSNNSVVRRRLLYLTIPIFIDSLLVVLLGTMDTIMLSRYSDNSVAAVGVVNQVFNMLIVIFQITNLGTSVLCSQYLGAGNREKLLQVAGVSLFFNFTLGMILSGMLYFNGETILNWMHLDPALMHDSVRYMKIVGGFAFVQSLSVTMSAILRSISLAKFPMFVTLIVNILNGVGNYALIFGNFGMPSMGAEGAAIATTASRIIALLILGIILYKTVFKNIPKGIFSSFPGGEFKKMLRIGLPAGGEQMSYSLSQVVVTMFANMISVETVTTRTYVMNIVMFTYLFGMSIALGNSILVGQLIGERRKEEAFNICLMSQKLSIVITGCLAGLVAAGGTIIMGLLTDNPAIIKLGCLLLVIDFVLEFGRSVNMMMVFGLRSTGDAIYPVLLGLFSMWVFATGLSWLFGLHLGWGLAGMWAAFAIDECFRAVILFRRWKSKKWMERDLILEPAVAN